MATDPLKSAREFLEEYPELDRYGDGTLTVAIGSPKKQEPLPEGVDWVVNVDTNDNDVDWKHVESTRMPAIVFNSDLAAIKTLKVRVTSTATDDMRLLHSIYGKTKA